MTGHLPESWRRVRLGDCLERRRSNVLPSSITAGHIDLVGLEDIEDGGRGGINFQKVRPSEVASLKTKFEQGDILYGKLRPYLNKVAIAPQSGYCSTEIWAFSTRSFAIPQYFRGFLSSPHFVERVSSLMKGANLPRLDAKIFDSIEVPLPSPVEQSRLALVLAEFEQIQKLRTSVAIKTTALVFNIYSKMFLCDPKRNNWPKATIAAVAKDAPNAIRTGPFGSDLLHSEFVSAGIPVLGIDNAVSNRFRWDERRFITPQKYEGLTRFRVYPGDVMITIMGTVGRVAVAPDDLPESISTKHLCVITPNHDLVKPFFLWAALLYDPAIRAQTQAAGRGAIMEGWNSGTIKKLRFQLPPLPLQIKFTELVREALAQEDALEASNGTAQKLTASLFAHAFTGELTAQWREENKAKLEKEAAERDAALKAVGVAPSRELAREIVEAVFSRRTDGAYSDLTEEQHFLLEQIQRSYGGVPYARLFTAYDLASRITGELRGNSQVIESHLAILAARGLVIAVSREQEHPLTGKAEYGIAYRLPLEPQNVTLGDEAGNKIVDVQGTGILLERKPGDRARGREMQRLADAIVRQR